MTDLCNSLILSDHCHLCLFKKSFYRKVGMTVLFVKNGWAKNAAAVNAT